MVQRVFERQQEIKCKQTRAH